ncbi:hypothetical protein PO909_005994 [Leuciscus waleckii]
MSKSGKNVKKSTECEASAACNNTCVASIASLLEDHRASISADFKTTFAALEAKLDCTQAVVTEHGQRIDSLESGAELQDQRIHALEDRCAALAESNARLMAKTSDLESRSRRNNIRIIGLPESIEAPELDRAHRALTAKPQPGSRPRPVIIRLHRYQIKEMIVREARKRRGDLQYRGSPVHIYEDYTPEVLEQRAKYRDVMSTLYNRGLKPSLLFPARLQITLPNGSDFLRYFQLRDFARTHSPQFPQIPPPSGIDLIIKAETLSKGHISYFYNLLSPSSDSVVNKIRTSWENELQISLSEDFWEKALRAVNSSSSCARFSLIQFKVVHRIHFSKARLAKIYPGGQDEGCNRCSQTPCDLTHMFWSCPKLLNFWQLYFDAISKILSLRICPSPHIAIFGRPPDGLKLTTIQTNVIAFTSLIARRKILTLWKSPLPPSFKAWLCDALFFLKLEKIKFTLRGSTDTFYSHWKPLINYVNQLSVREMSL